jgi:hypothetical protein
MPSASSRSALNSRIGDDMRQAKMLTWNQKRTERAGGDHRAARARDFDLIGVTVRVRPDDPIDDSASMATGRVSFLEARSTSAPVWTAGSWALMVCRFCPDL